MRGERSLLSDDDEEVSASDSEYELDKDKEVEEAGYEGKGEEEEEIDEEKFDESGLPNLGKVPKITWKEGVDIVEPSWFKDDRGMDVEKAVSTLIRERRRFAHPFMDEIAEDVL